MLYKKKRKVTKLRFPLGPLRFLSFLSLVPPDSTWAVLLFPPPQPPPHFASLFRLAPIFLRAASPCVVYDFHLGIHTHTHTKRWHRKKNV